jgi:hypothetical protein
VDGYAQENDNSKICHWFFHDWLTSWPEKTLPERHLIYKKKPESSYLEPGRFFATQAGLELFASPRVPIRAEARQSQAEDC